MVDLVSSGFFSPTSPDAFKPVVETLMGVDPYMVFADFADYLAAQQRVEDAYRDQAKWTKMSILNVARMGKFSTDRTIAEYNRDIWHAPQVVVK